MNRLNILLITVPIALLLGNNVVMAQSDEGIKSNSKKTLLLRPNSRDENSVRQTNYKNGLLLKNKHAVTTKTIKSNNDNRVIKPNKNAIINKRAATRRNRTLMRNRINRR